MPDFHDEVNGGIQHNDGTSQESNLSQELTGNPEQEPAPEPFPEPVQEELEELGEIL